MARIEVIFGSVLGVTLVAAGAFAAIAGRLPFPPSGEKHAVPNAFDVRAARNGGDVSFVTPDDVQAMDAEDMPAFTGDDALDRCGCYQRAFTISRQGGTTGEDVSLNSAVYASGYKSCRTQLGSAGANAWALGWSKGRDERAVRRSCRYIISTTK